MANALYSPFKQKLLTSSAPDLSTADIRCILVDAADYTFSAAHEFLSSVPAGARVAVSGALASKTVTDGVFDAADVTFTTVTGDPSEAVIIYEHSGSDATADLIAYIDTATGLPVTPNGGSITVTWSNGSSRIFAL